MFVEWGILVCFALLFFSLATLLINNLPIHVLRIAVIVVPFLGEYGVAVLLTYFPSYYFPLPRVQTTYCNFCIALLHFTCFHFNLLVTNVASLAWVVGGLN